MRFQVACQLAVAAGSVLAQQAKADTLSPVSYVKGKAFDRLAIIWLENTDYDLAVGDRKHLLHLSGYKRLFTSRAKTNRQTCSQPGMAGRQGHHVEQLLWRDSPV